jgi:hypothetical protein
VPNLDCLASLSREFGIFVTFRSRKSIAFAPAAWKSLIAAKPLSGGISSL